MSKNKRQSSLLSFFSRTPTSNKEEKTNSLSSQRTPLRQSQNDNIKSFKQAEGIFISNIFWLLIYF